MESDISSVLQNAIITTYSKQEMMDKMLSRHDMFVKYFDVCILTSIEKQSGAKIGNFIRQIKGASQEVLETYKTSALPIVGAKSVPATINLYIRCDDKVLSHKSNKILCAIYNEFLIKGIKIKLFALNGGQDKFACAVNNIINNYQIQQIRKDFLKPKTK